MPNHSFQGYVVALHKRRDPSDPVIINEVELLVDNEKFEFFEGLKIAIEKNTEYYHNDNDDNTHKIIENSIIQNNDSICGLVSVGKKGYPEEISDNIGHVKYNKNKDESSMRKIFFHIKVMKENALGMMIHYSGSRSCLTPIRRILNKVFVDNSITAKFAIISPVGAVQNRLSSSELNTLTFCKEEKNINRMLNHDIIDIENGMTVSLELRVKQIKNSLFDIEMFNVFKKKFNSNGYIVIGDMEFDRIKYNIIKNNKSYTIESNADTSSLATLRLPLDELAASNNPKIRYIDKSGEVIQESMLLLSKKAFETYRELMD